MERNFRLSVRIDTIPRIPRNPCRVLILFIRVVSEDLLPSHFFFCEDPNSPPRPPVPRIIEDRILNTPGKRIGWIKKNVSLLHISFTLLLNSSPAESFAGSYQATPDGKKPFRRTILNLKISFSTQNTPHSHSHSHTCLRVRADTFHHIYIYIIYILLFISCEESNKNIEQHFTRNYYRLFN